MLNESYYVRQFSKFESEGGKFKLTWNWAAFFFGGLWQLFRGLYLKFFVYGLTLYFMEWIVWKTFGPVASTVYPTLFLACLFVYGCVANYDLYLKKVKGENLWPSLSFKNWKIKIFIYLLVSAGIFFFIWNFSQNIWKGFHESNRVINSVDQAIEERLGVKSQIYYEVHFGTARNIYDLDVQLTLRPNQVFDAADRQIIKDIIRENVAPYGEIGRIKTSIIYQESGERSES